MPLIKSPSIFCEPFAGSSVVSLNVDSDTIIINDINTDLVNLYKNIAENGEKFIVECKEYFLNNTCDDYYKFRELFNNTTDIYEKSKLFVYLNRHCFNGLTRYNKNGKFNVPCGKYKTINFPEQEIRLFYQFVQNKNIKFYNTSFSDIVLYDDLNDGDVVYFDPPYVAESSTANFTTYSQDGFSNQQQIELVELSKNLSNRGITVIISNSDVEFTRKIYDDSSHLISISVNRSISAKSSSRKKTKELIAIYEKQN